jgi:hypothetical protein
MTSTKNKILFIVISLLILNNGLIYYYHDITYIVSIISLLVAYILITIVINPIDLLVKNISKLSLPSNVLIEELKSNNEISHSITLLNNHINNLKRDQELDKVFFEDVKKLSHDLQNGYFESRIKSTPSTPSLNE